MSDKCFVFELKFDCDNAAFDDNPEKEIANILRRVAQTVVEEKLMEREDRRIRDSNGNTVGRWTYYERP